MSNKRAFKFTQSVLAIAGLAIMVSTPLPVRAVEIMRQAGETAGNPAGQPLYQAEITTADIGESFPIQWQMSGRGDMPDLMATGTFQVVELAPNRLVLDVQVTNETTESFQAALMSMGFGVSPNPAAVTVTPLMGASETFTTAEIASQNFPGGFKGINVCIYASNGCSGGAIRNGLQSGGNMDSFRVEIVGNFGETPRVMLTSFPVKFQTEAGSYELAGDFSMSEIAESSETMTSEDMAAETMESETMTSETMTSGTTVSVEEVPVEVRQSVLQQVASRSNVSMSELRIVEARRQTWSNGCLGLGTSSAQCPPGMVSGWWMVVTNSEQMWVYRTNTTGSVAILDIEATQTLMARRRQEMVRQQLTTRSTSTQQQAVQVQQRTTGQTQTSGTQWQLSEQTRMTSQAQISQSVTTAVMRAVAQRTSAQMTNLRVVEVEQRTWSDACLGLPTDGACAQVQTPGWLVVVTNGQQVWAYRTDITGSQVRLDESATQAWMARWQQQQQTTQVSFVDVPSTHWANGFITELATLEVLQGFPDGRFRPNQNVTRAQFAAMLRQAFQRPRTQTAVTFVDVATDYWAYDAIREAYEMGFFRDIVQGSRFNPMQPLSRLDALLILARGLNLSPDTASTEVLTTYSDVTNIRSSEVQNLLTALTERGIVVNYPNVNQLNANEEASRAEVAAFVYQTLVHMGDAEPIASPYIVRSTAVGTSNSNPRPPRQNCNQGIGNGAEGCDPGNSRPHGGSNDEGGRLPGGRAR